MHLLISAALILFSASAGAHHPAPAPALAAASPTGPSKAYDAVHTVDAFHAAIDKGDTTSALGLLADDVLIYEEGGAERSKSEYAGFHLSADIEYSKAVPSRRTGGTAHGVGDLMWVASEYRSTGTWRGEDVDRLLTETMVLRREGNRWLIAHIHWSSAAAR